ncbi:hypothetical protein [Thermus phage P23-45]|uniref:Uncharacterized protein n=2 Tax=Oshimavirus TaxID=1623293 RepID=A7XXB3_BP234|nr:hypothetical protein P23p81 [Thermus phage P23-45]YP_001468050.1 hypothetical protein P74p80 [Thermus phage P74-26]ABU96914.1 hypothetical protein P23p81 [Thermus phage P23-45]ABU97030.1 hypothetical protein P74p80 [Thermus phage P74-26]UYB98510.1 hypothetical protein [Thermus phage P23-45]
MPEYPKHASDEPFGLISEEGEVFLGFYPEEDDVVIEATLGTFKVSKELLLQLADAIYYRFGHIREPKVRA